MTELSITVPGTPPSANHYAKHTRSGRHYVTAEAKSFWQTVRLYSKGRSVSGKEYGVRIGIYLGAKQKGDLDNFAKVCLDSLVKCGVIDSDAKVVVLHMFKERDRKSPRTEISVWDTGA